MVAAAIVVVAGGHQQQIINKRKVILAIIRWSQIMVIAWSNKTEIPATTTGTILGELGQYYQSTIIASLTEIVTKVIIMIEEEAKVVVGTTIIIRIIITVTEIESDH